MLFDSYEDSSIIATKRATGLASAGPEDHSRHFESLASSCLGFVSRTLGLCDPFLVVLREDVNLPFMLAGFSHRRNELEECSLYAHVSMTIVLSNGGSGCGGGSADGGC